MNTAEFLRRVEARRDQIMWFLGAGASAGAGIPTASDLTWRFKRQIYCSDERVPVTRCRNLADPVVRRRLQDHFEGRPGFPAEGAPEEYAVYFEAAYPEARDRRKQIETFIGHAKPSYGHHVLAAMLDDGIVRAVWTTNFDPLVEEAAASFASGTRLTVADLDRSRQAMEALEEERWPLLGKLHGDFQSRRLKNIGEELQEQDANLRLALTTSCRRLGFAVVGYSGRDDSVMRVLKEATSETGAFPAGLYWLLYEDVEPSAAVTDLIDVARIRGIDAHVVRTGSFDEIFGDLAGMFPTVLQALERRGASPRPRISAAPRPEPGIAWPVIRFNALPVTGWPSTARQVQCRIGGSREVREAISEAGAEVLATRRRAGVLAFGPDSEVRRVFEPHGISEFGLGMLNPDAHPDLGLLSDALSRAVGRERPVCHMQTGRRRFLLAEHHHESAGYDQLRGAVGDLTGRIPGTELSWWEAIELYLQYRDGRLWLAIDPTIFRDFTDDPETLERAKTFMAGRLSGRFNANWNALLDAWTTILRGDEDRDFTVRTFGIGDGVDATFTVSGVTGFSRRGARR